MATAQKDNAKTGIVKTSPLDLNTAQQIGQAMRTTAIDDSRLYDAIAEMDDVNFVSVSGEYLKLSAKTTYNIVAIGLIEMDDKFNQQTPGKEDAKIQAAQFKMKDSNGDVKTYVTAESVLLSKVSEYAERGVCPIGLRVKTGEIKEGKKGKYLNMEISVLFTGETTQAAE